MLHEFAHACALAATVGLHTRGGAPCRARTWVWKSRMSLETIGVASGFFGGVESGFFGGVVPGFFGGVASGFFGGVASGFFDGSFAPGFFGGDLGFDMGTEGFGVGTEGGGEDGGEGATIVPSNVPPPDAAGAGDFPTNTASISSHHTMLATIDATMLDVNNRPMTKISNVDVFM